MDMRIEHEIGKEFEIDGETFKVVKDINSFYPCSCCDFVDNEELCSTYTCSELFREDDTDVMFILVDSTKSNHG